MPNTRDLGGLIGHEGKIVRSGMLLRSGALYFAAKDDRLRLLDEFNLHLVVDLRGDDELAELPDPIALMPGVNYLHADILKGAVEGISQDTSAREHLEKMRTDQEDPAGYMEHIYPYILLGDSGVDGYRAFLQHVLETTSGAVLWHCHVGRDRCGMASMLMEAILGVSMSDMEEDYLATNKYTDVPSDERTAANVRFIRAAVSALNQEFGSIEGYIREALELDDSDFTELRGRYLSQLN